jgi:hypothetical protein
MFWRKKRSAKRAGNRARFLRVEPLESRHLLSGVVSVYTDPALFPVVPGGAPVAGDVVIQGDGSDNSVIMTVPAAGSSPPVQYNLTGGVDPITGGTTVFRVNGGASTQASVPLNGLSGTIWVDMKTGDESFDFEGPAGTGMPLPNIPGSLDIVNYDHNIDTINNAGIVGSLNIYKNPGSGGVAKVTINNCLVEGATAIATAAGSGDTVTSITNSTFFGVPAAPALTIVNGAGGNATSIDGSTTISGTPGLPAVVITNGPGGSNTVFSGNSTSSEIQVKGGVSITNAANLSGSGQLNQVTFWNAQVQGAVTIDNAGGDSKVLVESSQLGEDTAVSRPLLVANGTGVNAFYSEKASELPGGLFIDNSPPPPNPWGNKTIVDQTYVGETHTGGAPLVPAVPAAAIADGALAGDAMFVRDGGGPDTVVVRDNSMINGALDLAKLGSGVKQVAVDSSTMKALYIVTTSPGDTVWLGGANIEDTLAIALAGGGVNTVYLQEGATGTTPAPNSLPTGSSIIFGGAGGGNTLTYDTLDVPPGGTSDFTEVEATVAIPSWATTTVPSI